MRAATPKESAQLDEMEREAFRNGVTLSDPEYRSAEVDSLDSMQPVPRAGKMFAERILRAEVRKGGVILQEEDDPNATDMRTQRARVVQLGPAREGEAWDVEVGWEAILPFHAGYDFKWMSQEGITEQLWIVDTNEIIAIFKPR